MHYLIPILSCFVSLYRELRSSSKDAEEGNVCPWDSKSTPGTTGEAPLARDDICPWDDGPSASTSSLARAGSQETPAAVTPVPEIRVHAASSVDEDPTPGTSFTENIPAADEEDLAISDPEPAPSTESGKAHFKMYKNVVLTLFLNFLVVNFCMPFFFFFCNICDGVFVFMITFLNCRILFRS
jgi:hypothetical protein